MGIGQDLMCKVSQLKMLLWGMASSAMTGQARTASSAVTGRAGGSGMTSVDLLGSLGPLKPEPPKQRPVGIIESGTTKQETSGTSGRATDEA